MMARDTLYHIRDVKLGAFLCMEPDGNYDLFWSDDESEALRYFSMGAVPDLNIDLESAHWVTADGTDMGPLMD